MRVYWFFVGNNYARSGFPMFWKFSWYKAVLQQVIDYLQLDRGHIHIGHNSLAGASYAAFFAMCGFEGVTGLALYSESNPGGFWDHITGWTIPLLGGSFRVHMWHHLVAWLHHGVRDLPPLHRVCTTRYCTKTVWWIPSLLVRSSMNRETTMRTSGSVDSPSARGAALWQGELPLRPSMRLRRTAPVLLLGTAEIH